MIIDAHTHIGKKTVVASAEDLVRSMNYAGIDKALVFAGKLNDQSNELLLKDIEPFKDRLYGIGSISPMLMNVDDFLSYPKKIEELLANKLIYGLKFYVGYEYYYPHELAEHGLREIMELLVKYNKPAIFHSGDCYNGAYKPKLKYAHPLHIDELAVEMPELKIVIAHMGYPWIRDAAEVCYKNKNVYADMSGFVYGKFSLEDFQNYRDAFEEFVKICGGTHKLIFGTDWPISEQKSYVETAHSVYRFDTYKEREAVMGVRATELFGIV